MKFPYGSLVVHSLAIYQALSNKVKETKHQEKSISK